MTTYRVRVAIALLLGLGSITAGLLTWRAGQIGSSAAFEDRRAVGQEVASTQRRIEVTTDLAAAGAEYTRYLADQVEADAADANALAVVGPDADPVTPYGESLRRGAAVRAQALDLFPAGTGPSTGFAVEQRSAALAEQLENDLLSGGNLDPAGAAAAADSIRTRVRGLIWWTLVVLIAVASFTVAQVATGRNLRRGALATGAALYGVGVLGALSTDFFA